MDVYVKQILGSDKHDLFYTDATVKAAFKKYISGFVGRYKNEPTIMAWCVLSFRSRPPVLMLSGL
jgi:mannan endo-1,4-beta-mannosidase